MRVSGGPRFRFQNDNMVKEVGCLHRPAGYLSKILKIEGHLDCNAGTMCCRHTQEQLYCGLRACHSVFIGVGHISRSFYIQIVAGRSSWAVLSAAPPPTGLMRTPHTPGGYQTHAKD